MRISPPRFALVVFRLQLKKYATSLANKTQKKFTRARTSFASFLAKRIDSSLGNMGRGMRRHRRRIGCSSTTACDSGFRFTELWNSFAGCYDDF